MLNKLQLTTAVEIIDKNIDDLKDELSYLEAAKKNLQVLIDKDSSMKAKIDRPDINTVLS